MLLVGVRITLKVSEDEDRRVRRAASELGRSRQALYSMAVELFLVTVQAEGLEGSEPARRARSFLRSQTSPVDQEAAGRVLDSATALTDAYNTLAAQIRYVGHNLNQIARRVNAGRADSLDPDALLVLVSQVEELLDRVVCHEDAVARVQKAASCL